MASSSRFDTWESAEQTTKGRIPSLTRSRRTFAIVSQQSRVETLVPPNLRTTHGESGDGFCGSRSVINGLQSFHFIVQNGLIGG
jgi:hypothetical protein